MKKHGAPLLVIVFLLLVWEGAVRLAQVPVYILPPPSLILASLWEERDTLLLVHLPVTLWEVFLGLILSVVLGVLAAVSIVFTKTGEKVLYPLVIASQTIPIVALSPILIMWFGYSIWGKIAVTVFISFFPIVVNAVDGLRAVSRDWIQLMKTMGAGPVQIFWKLQVPSALPAFFSGLKVAATVSVVGATIGEWLGASEGLGFFSRRAANNLQADLLFASVVLLSVAGYLVFWIISILEKKTIPWYYRGANKEDRERGN